MTSLNDDAPARTQALPDATNLLVTQYEAAYPGDGANLHTHTFNVHPGATYAQSHAIHLFPGFAKNVLEVNMFVLLQSVEVRVFIPKSGVEVYAAVTANASLGSSVSSILSCKSAIARRGTDLSPGLETFNLPLNVGMSQILAPTAVGGKYPYLSLHITGQCTVSVLFHYRRGAGCITSSAEEVKPAKP